MFQTIKNAFSIPDLRKKILFTIFIIVIFRIGAAVPVPFIDSAALSNAIEGAGGNTLIGFVNTISGSAFQYGTLFAMGISPYINSSIIMQLLMVAIPALERIGKEGEEGRKKIASITRYVTVGLGLVQGFAFYMYLRNNRFLAGHELGAEWSGFQHFYVALVIIIVLTAGTALMMWFGEQINQYGIGNGISILLFAGIVAGAPRALTFLWDTLQQGLGLGAYANAADVSKLIYVPGIVALFLAIVVFIVFMNSAERRIPVQYAKRVVGRKVYGGQSTFMPIKISMSGVMPLIFASSILMVPQTLSTFIYGSNPSTEEQKLFWYKALNFASGNTWIYSAVTFVLVLAFAYFYVAIQYNPTEMANNLRKNSGTVPGIRPGQPTAQFIQRIISRITLIGALMLSVVAILPNLLTAAFGVGGLGMGGTSIIILVGVALDTVQQLESQMLMRHYKGFLE